MSEPSAYEMLKRYAASFVLLFTGIGIGLFYLYISLTEASATTKVLWASLVSIGVAFLFLILYWTATLARLSARLVQLFTAIGIGLLYLYIALSDATAASKVFWLSLLSIGVALLFLIVYWATRDVLRTEQREQLRRPMP